MMYPAKVCAKERFELGQDVWVMGVYAGCGYISQEWISSIRTRDGRKDYVCKYGPFEYTDGYFFVRKEQAMKELKKLMKRCGVKEMCE